MTKFKDADKLGSGGFGVVMKCVRDNDGAIFAKKILVLEDVGSVKRFQREVRILSKLSHPNIVRVEAKRLEKAPYWYVMPLYSYSLRNVLPKLVGDRRRIADVFGGILEGMEYAHAQGVIHRDLKPENILMNSDTDIAISDFGLGRALDAVTSRATGTGAWIGTPGYMAPEQTHDAASADVRSDIFVLGRMLYELLTGDPPTAVQDAAKLPVGLAEIVKRCTRTNPDERFQSVSELRAAFDIVAVSQIKPSVEEELRALTGQLMAQGTVTGNQTERLAELVAGCQEDGTVLHEVAVKLPETVLAALYRRKPEIAKLLIRRFAEVATSQGWPFSYTDEIGAACARTFDAIDDPETRAIVAATALEVGANDNRFYVMDIAARLVAGVTDDRTALALAHALRPIRDKFWAIEERLKVNRLHPAIREAFEEQ